MGKVIPFTGITKLDLPADQVLDAAMGKMEGVVILGYDKEGYEYFATTYADGGTVLWLLDRCRQKLIRDQEEEDR